MRGLTNRGILLYSIIQFCTVKSKKPIRKILIANRGEIAIRIARACRDLGIRVVMVYNDADRESVYLEWADEAHLLPGVRLADTYLNIPALLCVARKAGAEAVHPGYGLLSENSRFSRSVRESGFLFIGPPPEAMVLSGDKLQARKIAHRLKIPTVFGSYEPLSSFERAVELLRRREGRTFPVLVKAAAGGGGKGIRRVDRAGDFERAFQEASREAQSAFADGRVYLEQYLTHPRHIEVQILADQRGTILSLGERECSLQRRYQKVMEEAPAVGLTPRERERLDTLATCLMREMGYVNAGTVEFLYQDGKFYFMEINARLQVEHPVTESMTGLDLVKEQIRIAEGQSLGLTQEDIIFRGHAIECRICAEDPYEGFTPSTGKITFLKEPQGPGVRVDSGVARGSTVSIYFDPLLSKLIVWGRDRSEALQRIRRALEEYVLLGVTTNLPFFHWLFAQKAVGEGKFDTHFLDRHFHSNSLDTVYEKRHTGSVIPFLAAALMDREDKKKLGKFQEVPPLSAWKAQGLNEQLARADHRLWKSV